MLKYFFIILTIPLILVFIWFKEGLLLGHAEGALPFYKLERYLEPTKYAWMEHPGLGNISLLTTAAKPTYIFLTFLQDGLRIPGFLIQAGVFYFILAGAGMGLYLLTKEFFPNLPNRYAILSVFFYWFSPLSLSEVWNRFLLNYIFFYGSLPVLLLILIKGFKTKKYYYAYILTLLIGVYSFGISTFVFVLLLWGVFALLTFFFLITSKHSSERWFYIKFTTLSVFLFILTNSWWLTQLFSLRFQMPFSQTISNFSAPNNIETLRMLSDKLGDLTNVTRLINISSPEIIGLPWVNFFNLPAALIIEFMVLGLILITIIKGIKERSILILGGILFITIFLIKGVNIPLGEIYQAFFQRFSFLQIFRNPFEKFSFLLNLVVALLFGYTIFKCKWGPRLNIFFFLSLLLVVIMSYPFSSGLVFTSREPPTNEVNVGYKVIVPDYYSQTSDFMQSQRGNFRFIGFPLGDEGITYNWEKGYTGVELPSTLFSTPGILFNTAVPYYSNIVPQLENLLLINDNFLTVANLLNAKFLIFRSDIDWQERNMRDPQIILNRLNDLEKNGLIKRIGQYGELILWENLSWKDSTFYAANKVTYLLPEQIATFDNFADIANGETTVQGLPEEAVIENLLTKIIIYPIQSTNPANFEYESYKVIVPKESDYMLQFENLKEVNLKSLLESNAISINNVPLTSFDNIHLKAGENQMIVKNLTSENNIDLTKSFDSSDSRGYFKNFEIGSFDSSVNTYLISLEYTPIVSPKLAIYIFQDNDKVRNGEKITELNLNLNPNNTTSSIKLNSFFFIRPTATKAWVSLLSDRPIDLSSIKNLSVVKLIKPEPVLVSTVASESASLVPETSYQKINPTKYVVHIENSTSPFILVFSELFNNKWEAFFEDNTPVKQHFRANAYANGWFIDKKGNFDINVEFTPQRLYRKGEIISLISHIFNGAVLLTLLFKKKELTYFRKQKGA